MAKKPSLEQRLELFEADAPTEAPIDLGSAAALAPKLTRVLEVREATPEQRAAAAARAALKLKSPRANTALTRLNQARRIATALPDAPRPNIREREWLDEYKSPFERGERDWVPEPPEW